VLARVQDAEVRAEAEAIRQQLAEQRAKAVRPILARARTAEARLDYERAKWTAENALAVDPDCTEAKEILARALAKLEAIPRNPDDTVDLSAGAGKQGDPDDTVSFMGPAGLWERVVDAVKSWTQGERTGRRKDRPADDPQRLKT
jgi:hypothetical protein